MQELGPTEQGVRRSRRHGRPRVRGLGVIVGAIVLVPVSAALAVVGLLPDAGGRSLAAEASADQTTDLAAAAPVLTGQDGAVGASQGGPATDGPAPGLGAAADLEKVDGARASDLLGRAGQSPGGEVMLAWVWTDANGLNLLAGTRQSTGADGGPVTLRVMHLAGLDGTARELRTMRDPLRCTGGADVTAGFLDGSVSVRDLDGDGVADPVIGWWASCGNGRQPAQVKISAISDGRKFILRGRGYVEDTGVEPPSDAAPSEQLAADPAASSWPDTFLAATRQVEASLVR